MTVHPDYAKRYNQARDIKRILARLSTRPLTAPDRDRLRSIADDLRATADLVKSGGYLAVTLYWPADPDRGSEIHGPFKDEADREAWVDEVHAAADAGDPLLAGVHFILQRMDLPFEVRR